MKFSTLSIAFLAVPTLAAPGFEATQTLQHTPAKVATNPTDAVVVLPEARQDTANATSADPKMNAVFDAIKSFTNEMLVDTEKVAEMYGLVLEDVVQVPGVTVQSSPDKIQARGLNKRDWTDFIPIAETLTKKGLQFIGTILGNVGYEMPAKIVSDLANLI